MISKLLRCDGKGGIVNKFEKGKLLIVMHYYSNDNELDHYVSPLDK